jgi:hypothetical protein
VPAEGVLRHAGAGRRQLLHGQSPGRRRLTARKPRRRRSVLDSSCSSYASPLVPTAANNAGRSTTMLARKMPCAPHFVASRSMRRVLARSREWLDASREALFAQQASLTCAHRTGLASSSAAACRVGSRWAAKTKAMPEQIGATGRALRVCRHAKSKSYAPAATTLITPVRPLPGKARQQVTWTPPSRWRSIRHSS